MPPHQHRLPKSLFVCCLLFLGLTCGPISPAVSAAAVQTQDGEPRLPAQDSPLAAPTRAAPPTLSAPDDAVVPLQVSPLAAVPDDRPPGPDRSLLWVGLAALLVLAGAGLMVATR